MGLILPSPFPFCSGAVLLRTLLLCAVLVHLDLIPCLLASTESQWLRLVPLYLLHPQLCLKTLRWKRHVPKRGYPLIRGQQDVVTQKNAVAIHALQWLSCTVELVELTCYMWLFVHANSLVLEWVKCFHIRAGICTLPQLLIKQFVSLHVTTTKSKRKKVYYQHCQISCLEKNWNSKLWRYVVQWEYSF
jgi:hypothetical protein